MDMLQLAQILEIFTGVSILVKVVYDIKLDIAKLNGSIEQYTKLTEYKFEHIEEKLKELEENRV
jgi:hypothetical protein